VREKASMMLGWLAMITFKDGTIPYVNDSMQGLVSFSRQLFELRRKIRHFMETWLS